VEFTDEADKLHTSIFDQLMVANGHHWNPKYPEYPGEFTSTFMHSHDFKRISEEWRGKSVLVIGAGNSGCDIAVEAARLAGKACLSMRSPQWFVPKFIFGMPSDVFAARTNWMPAKFKQFALTKLLNLLQVLVASATQRRSTTIASAGTSATN
jgi:cation diffusion facilitator CzcD-associated flavoprotein CzcO